MDTEPLEVVAVVVDQVEVRRSVSGALCFDFPLQLNRRPTEGEQVRLQERWRLARGDNDDPCRDLRFHGRTVIVEAASFDDLTNTRIGILESVLELVNSRGLDSPQHRDELSPIR